jgi:hypothetical protein
MAAVGPVLSVMCTAWGGWKGRPTGTAQSAPGFDLVMNRIH